MPSAAEMPSIELDHTVTPSPTNPLGVKGIGEAGTIAATPAVMNAVVDALDAVRRSPTSTCPRRPQRVWTAITAAPTDRRCAVIPAAFDYVRADSADQAVALIGEHGDDAKLLAGGMSLIPLMKLRLATPTVLVDVGRVRDLSYVRDAGDHLAIGALTRHRDLETDDLLAQQCGVLRAVAAQVGDNQVRHRGTLGGSVAHGDPASDLPAALLALDATFVARRPERRAHDRRRRSSSSGSSRPRSHPTSCSPRSACPKAGANGFAYEKFNRRAQDWAIVGARRRARERRHARRAREHGLDAAAGARRSRRRSRRARTPADAAAHAAEGTEPTQDLNASPEYREHLARVLVRRALEAV